MSRDVREKMHGGCKFKKISITQTIANFKKQLPIVFLTSKILYCHQYFADFTLFVPLAKELPLHSWLIFRENGIKRREVITLLALLFHAPNTKENRIFVIEYTILLHCKYFRNLLGPCNVYTRGIELFDSKRNRSKQKSESVLPAIITSQSNFYL